MITFANPLNYFKYSMMVSSLRCLLKPRRFHCISSRVDIESKASESVHAHTSFILQCSLLDFLNFFVLPGYFCCDLVKFMPCFRMFPYVTPDLLRCVHSKFISVLSTWYETMNNRCR